LFFSLRFKKHTYYLTMLNELFNVLPESVAFQILTFSPHPDSVLIKEYWERQARHLLLWTRMHNIGMSRIRQDIDRIYAEMLDDEDDIGLSFGGFSNYYMDNHSPNADSNIYA
jgi:hypothetical protein